MKKLHVFANDVVDWVVAESPEDADLIMKEYYGGDYEPEEYGEFIQLKDDEEITILEEDTLISPQLPDKCTIIEKTEWTRRVKATARAWADCEGRGFLCSTEY
jgi:hypothetical protein